MATEVESSGLPVSVDSATPTGSEEQTAVWPLDYPVSVGLLERRIAETLGKVDATLDGIATDASVDEKVEAERDRAETAEQANAGAIAAETERAEKAERANADLIASEAARAGKAEEANAAAVAELDTRLTNTDNERVKAITALSNRMSEAETSLASKLDLSLLGTKNGVAQLDENGHVPSSQLPSYVDDVLEYASKSSFPETGESGKIYVALDTNLTYRWGGMEYVEISPSIALGETSSTAYAGDKGKANADVIATHLKADNPHGITAEKLGVYTKTAVDGKIAAATPSDYETVKSNAATALSKANAAATADALSAETARAQAAEKANADAIAAEATARDSEISGLEARLKIGMEAVYSDCQSSLAAHTNRTDNPHAVTAAQVGAYTKAETDAKISATDTTFSDAVLAVATGFDTNTVAQINELLESGDQLPTTGVVSVGAALAAVFAALARLKSSLAATDAKVSAANESLEEVA